MLDNCKSNVCDSASVVVDRWKRRIKFWITIGSIIFKVHDQSGAQTHALMCVTLSFFFCFFFFYLCIRATLACYIFGAMTDKIYEQKKVFFFKTYTNFSLLCIECTSTHEIKKRFFVRALSLLFPGIHVFGSLVHVIFFFSVAAVSAAAARNIF